VVVSLRRSVLDELTAVRAFVPLELVMALETDKIMFEVYRETTYHGKYKVIYFTELQDHNKEYEINRALAGEHYFDGFIRNFKKDQAKVKIESLLERLNSGEAIDAAQFEQELKPFMPPISVTTNTVN
jgi:hypothetical protein